MPEVTFTMTIDTVSTTVTVYAIDVTETWTSEIKIFTYPEINKGGDTTSPPITKIIDLKRVTRAFDITGFLTADPDNNKSARQVYDNLNNMRLAGGKVTMTYDGSSFNGIFTKVTISTKSMDEPSDYANSTDKNYTNISKYDVKILFIEGDVRGQE